MSDSRTMLTLMSYKMSGYFISLFVSAYSIVWLLTGMVHASNIERFALDICAYEVLPCSLAIFIAPMLAALHVTLGSLLLVGLYQRVSLVLSFILLAAYTFVATIALNRGLEVSCGCLGVGSPQISWGHVVVNLGLMFLCGWMFFHSSNATRVAKQSENLSQLGTRIS